MDIQIKNKNTIVPYEKDAQFLISRGISLYKQKKYSKALDCFDRAIKINPEFEDAWYNKGLALNKLGKHSEEMDCFDRAIKINPLYYRSWYYKGAVLTWHGQLDEAIICYNRALKICKKWGKF